MLAALERGAERFHCSDWAQHFREKILLKQCENAFL